MGMIAIGDLELDVGPWEEHWTSAAVSFAASTVYCQISITSLKISSMELLHIEPAVLRRSPFDFYPRRIFRSPLPAGMRIAAVPGPVKYLINAEITWATCFPTPNTRQDATFGPNCSSVVLPDCGSIGFRLHVKSGSTDFIYARASYFVST